MHRVTWNVKRAHYRAWIWQRRKLASHRITGLTPARFDVIQLLYRRGALFQKTIQRALGVAKSSASELLAKLEVVGFVERKKRAARESRIVKLTDRGRRAYRDAWELQSDLEMLLARSLDDHAWCQLEESCLLLRDALGEKSRDLIREISLYLDEVFYDSGYALE
jgi:DNA-binding MarR family transcriptional regulator